MKEYEDSSQSGAIILRRIIRELVISVEKLRSNAYIDSKMHASNKPTNQYNTTPARNQNKQKAEKDNNCEEISEMYKESLDILGVSMNELEEFVQPSASPTVGPKMQFEHTNDGTSVTQSVENIGPGLCAEDLDMFSKSNKDLEVFLQALDAIVEDPLKLSTECEDLVKIFKNLLQEIISLEIHLNNLKSSMHHHENEKI
jgi:hypothetical protein